MMRAAPRRVSAAALTLRPGAACISAGSLS
jgi:hypothetical protein